MDRRGICELPWLLLRLEGGLGIWPPLIVGLFSRFTTIDDGDRIVPGIGALAFRLRWYGTGSNKLLVRAGRGSATRSANDRNCWLSGLVTVGKGDAEASRLRGLRNGKAVVDEIDRGVYARIVLGVVVEELRYEGASVESDDFTTADQRGLLEIGVGPGRVAGTTGGVYTPWR
jgi:hypothetical protein